MIRGNKYMIKWKNSSDSEGTFESRFFQNEGDDPELEIYVEKPLPEYYDHAERCAAALNSLPQDSIEKICKGILGSAKKNDHSGSPLSDIKEPADILRYCWFTAVYDVYKTRDDSSLIYIVEGEGDWGENIGFVMDGSRLLYVGAEYFEFCDIL